MRKSKETRQVNIDKPDLLEALTKGKSDDKTARMIIRELINAKEIDLKTHFSEDETLTFAKADFFADEYENEGFPDCADIIRDFNIGIARKRLSYDRKSRGEFIEGVKPEIAHENAVERSEGNKVLR